MFSDVVPPSSTHPKTLTLPSVTLQESSLSLERFLPFLYDGKEVPRPKFQGSTMFADQLDLLELCRKYLVDDTVHNEVSG